MESLFLHQFSEAEKEGSAGQFLKRLVNGELE